MEITNINVIDKSGKNVGIFDCNYFTKVFSNSKYFSKLFGKYYQDGTLLSKVNASLKKAVLRLRVLITKITKIKIDNISKIDELIKSTDQNSFNISRVILYKIKLFDMEYNLKIIKMLLSKYGIGLKCYKNYNCKCGCFNKKCIECNFVLSKTKENMTINNPIQNQKV